MEALKKDKIKAPYSSSGTVAVCCQSNKLMKPVDKGGDPNYPKMPNVIPYAVGTDKNLTNIFPDKTQELLSENYKANLEAARARAREICKDTRFCCRQVKITSVLADTVYPFFSRQPGYSGEEIIDCNKGKK